MLGDRYYGVSIGTPYLRVLEGTGNWQSPYDVILLFFSEICGTVGLHKNKVNIRNVIRTARLVNWGQYKTRFLLSYATLRTCFTQLRNKSLCLENAVLVLKKCFQHFSLNIKLSYKS